MLVGIKLAPIVIFVYNRPSHTKKTIEALKKNDLALGSSLYIYCDAPKNSTDQIEVKKVRDYIHSVDGFNKVTIVNRTKNWGLACSIIDGVNNIVNRYGKVIVLEDDLVTSPYFLRFMNEALEYYKNESKVMHVSGYNYPINDYKFEAEALFFRGASCWGWATWGRAWKFFEKDAYKLTETFTKKNIYEFDYDGSARMWSQVKDNMNGRLNTWAIFWYASVFRRKGLCLHPVRSMVQNIGHDGTGINSNALNEYNSEFTNRPITIFPNDLVEDSVLVSEIKYFFKNRKKYLLRRILLRLTKLVRLD
jgi:GT2 family glycosyltransferase